MKNGETLGPFRILEKLGEGGMGQVYRAHDTRLDRAVALKVLPDAASSDVERLTRFRREAHILASLNHPHIASVYGFDDAGGRLAISMELVEGEGLDTRLARSPVALEEAIAIMGQIADGLEAAHERGIVHRDLKPANVRLTQDGTVKILDFGLAKAWEVDSSSGGSAPNAPTLAHETTAGTIVGTAAYMAPEQARGLAVDKRADIWAFGVLLYEILCGRRPFDGATLSDTLAAVLTRDPDFTALPSSTPDAIRTLLARCLQRDVRSRLRDIGEARLLLTGPAAAAAGVSGVSHPRDGWPIRQWLPVALLASVAGIAAGSFVPWTVSPTPARSSELLTVGIDTGGDTPIAGVGWVGLNWVGPTAVLSPDGRMLAFIARGPSGGRWQLYVRRLDELRARAVPGTEGAYAPFFSLDGRAVGFFAAGQLSKVVLDGGTVTVLAAAGDGRGGAWTEDGNIVFAPRPEGTLFRVPADGGTPSPLTTLDSATGETTHRWPQVLPGTNTVIFTAHGEAGRPGTVIAQTADGQRHVLQRGALFGRYAPSGHLLYVNEGKLFAAPLDEDRLAVSGRSVPVVDEVAHALINGTAQYSFSNTGLLTYRRARSRDRLLEWMEPSGEVRSLRNVAAEYQEARFSPDGTRLLLVIAEGSQSDVWVYDIERDAMTRVTFYEDNDWAPIWSPDGRYVVYSSWRPDVGTFNLFVQRASGGGTPQRLTTSRNRQMAVEWHPDGKHVLFSEERPGTGSDLMLLPIDLSGDTVKAGTPQPLLDFPSNELAGEFSPDGRWLAYTSDRTGRNEVFVQPFPGRDGGRWQVSTEGAEWVEWRSSAKLFYGRSEEVVMQVPYRVDGTTFLHEKPQVWMRIPSGVSWLEPSLDGSRAVGIRSVDARPEAMVLIVNFFEHLRRVAPISR